MYCQCESNAYNHEHQGRHNVGCNNQASEEVITHYGKYNLCKKCADHYENDGYVYKRKKL